jgi:hypothetical protein
MGSNHEISMTLGDIIEARWQGQGKMRLGSVKCNGAEKLKGD